MSILSRRALIASIIAAPAATAALGTGPVVAARTARRTLAPLATIRIGRFEVIALTDGFADMPYGYFTGRAPEAIRTAAAEIHAARGDGLRLSFNQFLIRDGNQNVLIDAGPAGSVGESGKLQYALASVGVRPGDIDAVIATHLHFDHISGLVAGGRKVFRNAEVYADRRDVTYWTDPANRASAPDFLKSSFDATAELLRLYPKINRIDGEREIARGISIVDLTGHTPGHIGVRVADAGQSLIMVSDMLFHPAIHPGAPEIGFVFEQDPEAARRMRERFFPRAAEEKSLIAATHLPFPGLGRIARQDGRLGWIAADWASGG